MPELTYPEVGATAGALPDGYRHVRIRRTIGRGRDAFERAGDDLLRGEAQKRAGVDISLSQVPLRVGTTVRMRLPLGFLAFSAPCRVVWAERTAERAGFAYGTLPRHPLRGEERFELRLLPTGDVCFSITAFSAPGRWFTRLGAPLVRVVQTRMIRRYLDALVEHSPEERSRDER
ncbi:DUF1990 domain-containing protein [Microbacterium sp. 1P10UB]|uniref:DUF1990 family protein n=1 Tax=unclassified Microbacterium TaxID=2609290 RepID=UPI0039A3E5ED